MPYIESKSNVGFLPFNESPSDFDSARIIDEIEDQLQGDRYASTKTASEEALDAATELLQQGMSGSETGSELSPVDIATDSEGISVQSHHSSSSELNQVDDMFASHLSTSTVRRKSGDDI